MSRNHKVSKETVERAVKLTVNARYTPKVNDSSLGNLFSTSEYTWVLEPLEEKKREVNE